MKLFQTVNIRLIQKMPNKFMKPEFKAENIQVKNLKNLNHKNVSVVEELKYQIQEIIFVNLVTVNIIVISTKQRKY